MPNCSGFFETSFHKTSTSLLQLVVFRFGLLQDGDVGVAVFPECEEILIRSTCFSASGVGCGALRQFTPNYAAEVGVFQSVRWEHFPLTIWIDSSTVENSEEMSELRAGLSKWSDATGGVFGVTFVEKQDGAQILVKMVDKLPGANGRTRFAFTEHGIARLATIEIVHAHWAGAPPGQIKTRTVGADAAHEMGHALGILGHTTQPGTIMFRIPMADSPSRLDVNTIKTKYCELF